MSTYGQVSLEGKNLKLFKLISVGHSRNGLAEQQEVDSVKKRSEILAKNILNDWDLHLSTIRANVKAYPWSQDILDYKDITPKDSNQNNGKLLMIILDDIFTLEDNRGDYPDRVYIRVNYNAPSSLEQELKNVFVRRYWKMTPKTQSKRQNFGKYLLTQFLQDPSTWDHALDETMLYCEYSPEDIQALKNIVSKKDPLREKIATRILQSVD